MQLREETGLSGLNINLPPKPPTSPRFILCLLLLFFGSGCSALIYEIVWFQLLQLVIGSSAVSLGVLLGAYMGGMCLGSIALPRFIPALQHPLRVYALLEIGIGISGIMVLLWMPAISSLYASSAGYGFFGIILRGTVCAVCLVLPTVLMGATLPVMARWVGTTTQGASWLGFLYGGNIAGAMFGCLLAGFYLLRVYDSLIATFVAAAINGAVGLVSLALAHLKSDFKPPLNDEVEIGAMHQTGIRAVYLTIALSGLCALGAEVIWTRFLSLLLGGTVYTFSIILAVFLLGLGLGSSVGAFWVRGVRHPRVALGYCQMLLTLAISWAAFILCRSLPYWPIDASLSSNPWINFQLDMLRCVLAILPAACLWGASFPLALAAIAPTGEDASRLVGKLYAANTAGAIGGAVGFSMLLIPWLGTQQSQRLLIALALIAALLMLVPSFLAPASKTSSDPAPQQSVGSAGKLLFKSRSITSSVALLGIGALLMWSVPSVPEQLIAYGRQLPLQEVRPSILYLGEGMNASIAVSQLDNGVRNFHVSGKVEASTEPQDMRLQRMLGHIPALIHPKPRSVLIVGFGSGATAGSFVLHPDVKRIVICEIEPLIPQRVASYFARENYNVLNDPRVAVVYDDARHYILTTREKFDIITSDPIHPWVKGAAALYTQEYFELCKRHLNEGGLITQWVPLYESNADAVKSEIATFFNVFPNGTIWGNVTQSGGYDTVLLGQADVARINAGEIQQRLNRADYQAVVKSLEEVKLGAAGNLLLTYAGQASGLQPWLVGAQINRDRNLRLQYLAGMGLNSQQSERIYKEILGYGRFPREFFEDRTRPQKK